MAKRLESYDWTRQSKMSPKGAVYPWADWFDGSIWMIERGVDFFTHPLMMERVIRTKTTAAGGKIVIRHEGQGDDGDGFGIIVFQRTDVGVTSGFSKQDIPVEDPYRPRRPRP